MTVVYWGYLDVEDTHDLPALYEGLVDERKRWLSLRDGELVRNALLFVERLYRTLKEECVWPNEFQSFEEALAAITAWVDDYNLERPHQSLKDRTPAEARAEALTQHNYAA